MTCFAVFQGETQLRVYSFENRSFKDRKRAKTLAFNLAHALHADGRSASVQEFTSTGRIGELVLDLPKPH